MIYVLASVIKNIIKKKLLNWHFMLTFILNPCKIMLNKHY